MRNAVELEVGNEMLRVVFIWEGGTVVWKWTKDTAEGGRLLILSM